MQRWRRSPHRWFCTVRSGDESGDEPLIGKQALAALFAILLRTFEDLRFVGSYTSTDGAELLHFRWRLANREVEGVDMMRFDDQGLVDQYTVMIRPLSGVEALRDAVFS